jgi:hypothetical protein
MGRLVQLASAESAIQWPRSASAQRLTKHRLRALAGHVNAAAKAISLRLGAKANPRQINAYESSEPDIS